MHVPVPRPEPITVEVEVTDSSRCDDFASLARALREQGAVTLVYAPSTTTIHNTAPNTAPTPIAVTIPAPAGPSTQAVTHLARSRPGYTLGDVIAYSGATLMGGAVLSELVASLLRVPMLVPVLGGVTGLVGMLAVIGGALLDINERHGATR